MVVIGSISATVQINLSCKSRWPNCVPPSVHGTLGAQKLPSKQHLDQFDYRRRAKSHDH